MAKFITMVDGIPTLQDETIGITIYEANYNVNSTITTGTPVTLPNAGEYTGIELEVYLNGQLLEVGVDYSYIGVAPRTQISFAFDLLDGDVVKFRVDKAATIDIYDETYDILSTITSGTYVTLPNSGNYSGDELEVYLNGIRLDLTLDYNYVGVVPRTQVSFTFDLYTGDKVRFRIEVPV